MNLQKCWALARLTQTVLTSVDRTTECKNTVTFKPIQTCMMSALSPLTLHTYCKETFPPLITSPNLPLPKLYFTCRESPGGRPSVAQDSSVSPCLYRSSREQSSACVVQHSPLSGRGRRAAGGWTQWEHGLGTSSVLCGIVSCCRFHPCLGPPCYRSRCRRSVASCSCYWDCRLWLHQGRGCSFSQHRGSETLSGLQSASLTVDTKKRDNSVTLVNLQAKEFFSLTVTWKHWCFQRRRNSFLLVLRLNHRAELAKYD